MSNHPDTGRHVALGTISFFLCFAMWGLLGPVVYKEHVVAAMNEIGVGEIKLFSYPEPADACIMIRMTADHVAGYDEAILPAAGLISGIIFAACAGLFVFIHRIDATVRTTR